MSIHTKAKEAIQRIEQYSAKFKPGEVFIGHSGGKDSCVIHHLTRQVIDKFVIVHNVKPLLGTSGDPVAALTEMHPATLQFLYSEVCRYNHVQMMHSSMMPQFIQQNGLKCQIDGSRACEALREGKSSEFIHQGQNVNRKEMVPYIENGIFDLSIIYPIYDWTDDEVFEYIRVNNLPLSDEYV